MPTDIDELSLQIAADSTAADRALNSLAASLETLKGKLTGDAWNGWNLAIAGATRSFNEFVNKINGTKINIDLQIGGNNGTDPIKNAIAEVSQTIDGSGIAESLAKEFGVVGEDIEQELTDKVNEALQGVVASFNGEFARLPQNFLEISDAINTIVRQNGNVIRDELYGSLDDSMLEYKRFLDYVRSNKINVSGGLVDKMFGKSMADASQRYVGYISNMGTITDRTMSELKGQFQSVLSALDLTANQGQQLKAVFEAIDKAREVLNAKPITQLSPRDLSEVTNMIEYSFSNAFRNAKKTLTESLVAAANDAKNQFNVDLKINQEKITKDVQNALSRAISVDTEINFKPKLNTKVLRDAIRDQIGKIDLGSLPEMVSVFERIDKVDSTNIVKLADSFRAIGKANVKKAIANLQGLAPAIDSFANEMVNLEFTDAGTERLVALTSAIGNFGKAAVQKAIVTIPQLTEALRNMMNEMAALPEVKENTIRFIEAIAKAAPVAKNFKDSVKEQPGIFSRIGSGLANMTKKFGSFAKGLLSHINPVKKMRQNLIHLFRAMLPFLGIRQLFNWGKQATEIASDLVEIQNVVDVTFQGMSDKVDEFTETSIESFGITELAAKRMASRFQSMGAAMGIANSQVQAAGQFLEGQNLVYGGLSENIADVSLNLTKLAADMASFYNVDQSEAAEALQSIYTGMARPMRRFGLDLTQATLQEWALKNGLDADVQSMTQAEKTMLRYQYVMSNLGFVQGDFAETSQTWANQVRILKQQFEDLGKTIGTILINTFKPFVRGLNVILANVRKFAKEVLDALGQIFGWTVEVTSGGSTFEDMADGTEDLADGLGDAADAAKKAKNTILAFDELNVLNGDDKSSKSGGGSGADALAEGVAGATYQLRRSQGILKKYESEVKNLQQLGEKFAKAIKKALGSIDWDGFREKVGRAGIGLADFFNGFNDPEMFAQVGNALAQGVNGIINFAYTSISRFDANKFASALSSLFQNGINNINWTRVQQTVSTAGEKLASFLNGILTPENGDAFGNALGNIIQGGINFALGFIKRIDWNKWGKSIAAAINKAVKTLDYDSLFSTLSNGIAGLGTMLGKAIHDIEWDDVLTAILAGMAGIMDGLIRGIVNLIKEVAPELGNWIETNLLPEQVEAPVNKRLPWSMKAAVEQATAKAKEAAKKGGKTTGEEFGNNTIENIESTMGSAVKLTTPFDGLVDVIRNGIKKFCSIQDPDLKKAFENYPKYYESDMSKGWEKSLGIGLHRGAGKSFGEELSPGGKTYGEIHNAFYSGDNSLFSRIGNWFKNLLGGKISGGIKGSTVAAAISNPFLGNGSIATAARNAILNGENALIPRIGNWIKNNLGSKIGAGVKNSTAIDTLKQWFGIEGNIVTKMKTWVLSGETSLLVRLGNWFKNNLGSKIGSGIYNSTIMTKLSDWFGSGGKIVTKLLGYVSGNNNSIINQTGSSFKLLPTSISDAISNWNWITNWSSATQTNIDKQSWPIQKSVIAIFKALVGSDAEPYLQMWSAGDWAAAGLWNGMNYNYDWLLRKVAGFADSMVSTVKKIFKIGSPSKVMEDVGAFWTEGLGLGIESGFGDVYSSVNGFSARLASMQIATPQLSNSFSPLTTGLDNATVGIGFDMDSLQDAVISGVQIALSSQQERPVNVYATLKTENDEVLARAVTRGQRSIDYRNNPTPSMA